MATKFVHTNLVSKDVEKLAEFYVQIFECEYSGKKYEMMGEWLEKGVNISGAKIFGISLKLPGYTDPKPELEIFQYNELRDSKAVKYPNELGFGHLAFHVDDVDKKVREILANGGSMVGEIVNKEFKNGTLTFVYVKDPEGNIIEIQNYRTK